MMCKNGLVASEHPLASMAGIKILESGGNAIDASIAVNSVLNVVEPSNCGIGDQCQNQFIVMIIHYYLKNVFQQILLIN